jgi:UTP--glucose-1-phosphate uridylyltransferase
MQPITTAVILAAGLGTRMLPATKSVPKEMLPIVDRPLVQYCVDEAVAGGLTEIVFVIAEGKEAIRSHFEAGTRVERALRETGNEDAANELLAIGARATFHYVLQGRQLGIAHAVNCARHLLEGKPFALMFPDDLLLGPSCIGELVAAQEHAPGSMIAVETVPDSDVSQYGIVDPVDSSNPAALRRVVEKPALADAPSRLGIVGRYILSETIFTHIDGIPLGKGGELQITDALASQIEAGETVSCFKFSATRYDTGRPLGYLTASVAAAMDRPEIAANLRERLRPLLNSGER